MFNASSTVDANLTDAINSALHSLEGHDPESDEYRNIVNQLTALNAIQDKKKNRINRDTLILAATNLLGILMIINHEQTAVITSKALPFIGRTKLN